MLGRILVKLGLRPAPSLVQVIDLKAYWQDRAKIYGKRAVYNLGHGESELEDVTSRQHHAIFPLLESMPLPPDPEILDFGCGPGRFSLDIATATGGRVVGVDFTPELLDLAPRSDRVSYQVWDATFSESNPGRFDLIWVCLVLGGIPDPQIGEAISALKRMMKPGSWIVLAENTTRKPNSPAWSFRAVRWYEEAFSDLALKAKTSYNDLGEKITVFIGGGPA